MSQVEELVPNPDVVFTELADGTPVLVNEQSEVYYTLNATGTMIWKAINKLGGNNLGFQSVMLNQGMQIAAEQAQKDLSETLSDMLSEGLLLRPKN